MWITILITFLAIGFLCIRIILGKCGAANKFNRRLIQVFALPLGVFCLFITFILLLDRSSQNFLGSGTRPLSVSNDTGQGADITPLWDAKRKNSMFYLKDTRGRWYRPWWVTQFIGPDQTETFYFNWGDGEKVYGLIVESDARTGVYRFENSSEWPDKVILSTMVENLEEPDPEAVAISHQFFWYGPGRIWLMLLLYASLTVCYFYLTFGWPKSKNST